MSGYMGGVIALAQDASENMGDESFEAQDLIDEQWVQQRIDEVTKADGILGINFSREKDASWVDQSMTAKVILSDEDQVTRFMSTADNKFVDSSVGGNWVINPLPQFCRYTDIRSKGLDTGRQSTTVGVDQVNLGMGHYYSEAIDDTKHVVHMRFGVPEYNSMTSFFTSFFDSGAALEIKSGSILDTTAYTVGTGIGFVFSLTYWPLLLLHIGGLAGKYLMRRPRTKFYYLRPAMTLYWATVSSMLNQIVAYKRIIPANSGDIDDGLRTNDEVDKATVQAMANLMPGMFDAEGYFDVAAIANKTQVRADRVEKQIAEQLASLSYEEMVQFVKDRGDKNWFGNQGNIENSNVAGIKKSIEAWANRMHSLSDEDGGSAYKIKEQSVMMRSTSQVVPNSQATYAGDTINTGSDQANNVSSKSLDTEATTIKEALKASFNDGLSFASFRVDYPGSVGESFSSSTRTSDLQTKFNSTSADARNTMFSFSNGNVDGGVISAVFDAAKSLVNGFLNGIQLSGLAALAGSAFIDIPEHWDNSVANLPKMDYSTTLISPYNNPISHILHIDLPLCMLLAAALPLSTGTQSYTSPFLVELYDKGRAQTRLGIIDSLSITRGTSNLGFAKDKTFLAAEVSFSVKDLSTVMHMPAGRASYPTLNPVKLLRNLNPITTLFPDDNNYSDYLHVLASSSLRQQLYVSERIKDNWAITKNSWKALTSKDAWMGWLHETPLGILDILSRGTGRS